MKKSLFVLVLSLLTSCSSSINIDSDKEYLQNYSSSYASYSDYFTCKLTYEDKTSYYLYNFTLGNTSSDFNKIHVLLNNNNEFYYFGYDGDYSLVKDSTSVDTSKKIYKGINIHFSQVDKISEVECLFYAENFQKIVFKVTTGE